MTGTPTDTHHDWVTDTLGFDPRTINRPVDGDADQPGSSPGAVLVANQAGGGGATWNAPFDLGSCDDTADACRNLVDIKAKLQEWDGVGYDAEMKLVNAAIDKQLSALTGSRPLTATEAQTLTAVGLMAVQATRDALKNLAAAISAELDKYTGVEAQAATDTAAELLHQEFRKGEGSNKIADLKEICEKAGKMTGDIKKYVGYAEKTKSFIKSAAKLEELSKGIEEFKGKLETAEHTLSLASDVATLAGKVGQKPSGTANDINKIKATLDIVDFAISKSKVPIIGQWWTGYIKPCAEMALEKLQKLDDMIDTNTRSNLADEWWQNASKGMRAPSITDSGLNGVLLAKVFPAGQPMLDFMWSFFRGNPPDSAPEAVAKEFLKFRKQFNASLPEADQLQTDAAWYNAWDAFGDEKSPNLLSWVAKNKEFVWAAEYGALPHP
jgi:hypothetical protein